MQEIQKSLDDEVLTIQEAADFLKIKVSKLRREVFLKKIKYFKFGALLRFKKIHLIEWRESHFRDAINTVAQFQIQ